MNWIVALTTFVAASVEWVEALTIVLAAGVTVGWRPALRGTVLGFAVLLVIVAVFGLTLAKLAFLKAYLQVLIGVLLLLFGLRWLSKATLRSAGIIPLHDEEAAFEEEAEALRRVAPEARTEADQARLKELSRQAEAQAQLVSFKGVFLEGLEVAFIVVAFGSGAGLRAGGDPLLSAVAGAMAALVLVGVIGLFTHRPLSQVPENTLKYAVGLALSSFGLFWSGEGLGVGWPGADLAILGFAVILLLLTRGMVALLSGRSTREA